MSDMITDLFSKVFDTANIVNPVRQNHEDIGNAFDEESSAADANSVDAEAASADTSDAKGVLADDQVKQSEAAEAESQAQQAASDAAKLFGDLQGIAEQLGEYATQMYLAFVAALSGGDADTINAASERASEANSQYTEAQNRADEAGEKSQEANEKSEQATEKREDLDGQVAEDEETVAECEAAEAEIADEGASIGGDLDTTRSDAEAAAQYDEQQEPQYYDNYGGDTGADPVNPAATDDQNAELTPAGGELEPVDPIFGKMHEKEIIEAKIQNNEIADEKMVELMTEDIFSGDIANTSMDELVGLNAQDAIAKVNENLKAQSLYTGNISTTMDTASVDENQEAISDFYDAYLDIQDKLAQEGVEFLTTADEVNYAILAGIAEKLNASEYVMTAEIKKATSTADSIQVTTSDVTEVENKEAEIKGATLLKELEAVITDDPDAKEDENDDVLTQKEYDEEDNFFENAENKANAYEKLAKDAEKYNIFALAA